MFVYYVVIGCMCCLVIMDEYVKQRTSNTLKIKPQVFTSICIVSILALVAGLRYNVGTDYYNYYAAYDHYKEAPLILNDEPGLKVIARLSSKIYDDPATMMFIAAVVTVILMVITILRNSDMFGLSILLYIFLGCWHGCFNGVRQYLAAAVLFAGHHCIKEKKFLQWCVVVFLASMFHITAIIGVFFYFFPKIKISFKQLFLSIIGIYVGLQVYEKIFSFIGLLKNDTLDFTGVGSGYLTNSISPFRIAVAWIPVLFFLVFKKHYDLEDEKKHFYINMSLLHAILMTAASNSTYLGRVGIYTGVYNTIVWPLLIKEVEPRSRKVLLFIMLICYFLYWRTEATGPTLINFQWIFER